VSNASLLQGKWALVTGAGDGLGFALAESLAEAGANVVLHDLVEPSGASERIRSRFPVQAVAVAADLRGRDAIEAMMVSLLGKCGGIDILVNNAVVRHFSPVEDFAPANWDEALAVNLSAPFHLTRLVLPGMKERGWGRIINLASIYSSRGVENRIDYVTTKTAIVGLTRAVAVEMARTGVTCNALGPGTLPTPAIVARIAAIAARERKTAEEATAAYLDERQPSGRFVSLRSVGAAAVFLCSDAAADITGTILPIDGGWSAI
jgi:3-hydroxybutyrate dehydrogenase